MMANNDQFIIKGIFQKEYDDYVNSVDLGMALSQGDYFERFSIGQILKDYALSGDEIEQGIVGGGNDGGIDGVYLFINGNFIDSDTDISGIGKKAEVELFIIQCKKSETFTEEAINKLYISLTELLDFSLDFYTKRTMYNKRVLDLFSSFKAKYSDLLTKSPRLIIKVVYVSLGDSLQIHEKVRGKMQRLLSSVKQSWTGIEISGNFVDATELKQMYNKSPSREISLSIYKNPVSTSLGGGKEGYLCLVSLDNYYKFITDDNGDVLKSIFDANIRDYQNGVAVNEEIAVTLANNQEEDFWWLNNGITIVASKGSIVGEKITLEDPQIVNGLQTSNEIYRYFSKKRILQNETRTVLVRVIVTKDQISKDRIIKATNSQTAILPASLHATDEIQRNIENYFASKGSLYYDRRKNFYKNLGYPTNKIISIQSLAQAVNAILLQEPHLSRGRPSTLVTKQENYNKVFNLSYPVEMYLICALIYKKVDQYLKREHDDESLKGAEYYIVYHVSTYVTAMTIGKSIVSPKEIVDFPIDRLDSATLRLATEIVFKGLAELSEQFEEDLDTLVKKKDSTEAVILLLTDNLGKPTEA